MNNLFNVGSPIVAGTLALLVLAVGSDLVYCLAQIMAADARQKMQSGF